ncbi:PD-(D/E)XK nuclease family transposase [Parapusillimonas sp. SGNA-6]|uniref:Rpn family recombination-promoting nuclease/putative transposase n=1 Tax=Parapedobacter sp. SGR-10 TaxID=2710879 RepID=UPI0013D619BA|nr:Rpn family recombination-promoting nuclease/putative transposase [Parapedobacter sp. SGR-10]NGF55673.1 PD-(D/E)XK nuclease family transposase [Parapedobacter sp. SGR-10]NGM89172.1 PD-(D/E)XK nuclease family transposase [Parapusillimonas sp. SGNA-6]
MAKTTKPTIGTYIDPLTDFAFKKLFGSEPNKDLLIDFLNGVFRGRKHIVDLVYNKNEHPGETVNEGGAIFDLTCTGNDGEQFIIEVQRGKQGNFKQRAIFYTSRLITEQAPKGKRSEWAYNVKEVYLIALLEDFSLDAGNEQEFLHDICLSNRETGKVFYEGLGYIFIELIKFVKTEAELDTDLDKWLYVLKNMSSMDKIPVYLRKPIFEKLFNIAEYSNLTKEEKTMYDTSLKRKWDNKAVLDYAVNEAAKEAKQEEKMEIAREMKKDGIPVEQIAKFTKLSIAEIEKL